MTEFFTCEGKGGEYELLGVSTGAGTASIEERWVYRDTTTGQIFHRKADDFQKRMVRLTRDDKPAEEGKQSRFEAFKARFRDDPDQFQKDLRGDGTYSYMAQAKQLERLSIHLNLDMMLYLFGEYPGRHLAEKFAGQCGRNILFFFSQLTAEYRMFILYELKTNPHVLHYG